jgi:hypothetical protein
MATELQDLYAFLAVVQAGDFARQRAAVTIPRPD